MIKLLIFCFLLNSVLSKEYKAVETLNLDNYIGKWYQVYENNFDKTFQGNSKCSKAYYDMNPNNITVLNTQISSNGDLENITGFAYYKDEDYGGYLTVKLKDTPEAPYWVIELGPIVDNYYDYSIVSDNIKLSLFVLTRNVSRYYDLYDEEVLLSLDNFGFKNFINKPLKMDQDC